jgi:hypothetical protein
MTPIQYYLGDQMKKNEMGGECGTYGEQDSCIQDFGGENWKTDTTCKDLGVEERILQSDQKVSVHLMIKMSHCLTQSDYLAADRQGQGTLDSH